MATIQETLRRATQALSRAGQTGARRDAQVLLCHVLGVELAVLYAYPEREVTSEQEQRFSLLIERRAKGEPVAYLIGRREFYGRTFLVDPRVLIPRPETEILIDEGLQQIRQKLQTGIAPIVADIGTGSGIIPITLLLEEPAIGSMYAVDISAEALQVAQENAQLHHIEQRVHWLQGDLTEPLPQPVDVLTANLPYVGTEEQLDRDVYDYEPHLALFSGPRGLDLLRRFLHEVFTSGKLRPRGVVVLEIGYQQASAVTEIVQSLCPEVIVTTRQDYAGWDRVVVIAHP
uniref:Release factor glutamine methyltransferase n=1 Tax=Thermosporothrix sp. COM3 TaxID=2490863 RepID=A0A455SQP7_9CHLR|nr:release factor glutamine methyltransferase [Thermosporothrix sp. COM3]